MSNEIAATAGAVALFVFLSVSTVVGMGAYGFIHGLKTPEFQSFSGDCVEISGETIRPIKLIVIREFNGRHK